MSQTYGLLSVAAAAFALSCGFTFILRKISLRRNLLILKGMPLTGGVAFGLAFICAFCLAMLFRRSFCSEAAVIIMTSFFMLVIGVIDDIRELSVKAKFSSQILAVCMLVFFGVTTQIMHIGLGANIAITFLWVIFITNAVNHLDIIDGLAGSTGLVCGLGFMADALLRGDAVMALLICSFIGALAGFLVFNLPPAKVYMGNNGSHFMGFFLASAALVLKYASQENKFALMSPFLILGLPIFDTSFLMLMRLFKSRSIFKKSNDHLALRFLKNGHSPRRALVAMSMLALLYSVSGIFVMLAAPALSLAFILIVLSVSLVLGLIMSRVVIDG